MIEVVFVGSVDVVLLPSARSRSASSCSSWAAAANSKTEAATSRASLSNDLESSWSSSLEACEEAVPMDDILPTECGVASPSRAAVVAGLTGTR